MRATAADAVLDGEIVVMDASGRPSFRDLAERMHVRDHARAARLAATTPVTYLIFDVLRLNGVDLLEVSYAERRLLLEERVLEGQRWLVPPSFDDGTATQAASREYGLEGVVAKRLASPYRRGPARGGARRRRRPDVPWPGRGRHLRGRRTGAVRRARPAPGEAVTVRGSHTAGGFTHRDLGTAATGGGAEVRRADPGRAAALSPVSAAARRQDAGRGGR